MLGHVHVQNFVTIADLKLDMSDKLTVITGETGAGKSILIDAIEILLGARTSQDKIRDGEDKAFISALFDISLHPAAKTWLTEHDLLDESCLIRRVIARDGKNKNYINGHMVTVKQLRAFGQLLVNIHGQHEQQKLLQKSLHRELIDTFGELTTTAKTVEAAYDKWQQARTKLVTLQQHQSQRQDKIDLLQYHLSEFEALNLTEDSLKDINQQHKTLANAETIREHCQQATHLLKDAESGSAVDILNKLSHHLECASQHTSALTDAISLAQEINVLIEELNAQIAGAMDNISCDGETLSQLENTLSQIHDLARKHKVSQSDLIAHQEDIIAELKRLKGDEDNLTQLQQTVDDTFGEYYKSACSLSNKRKKVADKLPKQVVELLCELNMPHARFEIELEPLPTDEYSRFGLERIRFLVSTNPEQPLRPLEDIVSGGELSRISLALEVITRKHMIVPTLIFDEVDVGIGGGTAEIVGKLLKAISDNRQVLCITHLAQVASQGDTHLKVDKLVEDGRSITKIQALTKSQRIEEVARMLGGKTLTQHTKAHAKEMLESLSS